MSRVLLLLRLLSAPRAFRSTVHMASMDTSPQSTSRVVGVRSLEGEDKLNVIIEDNLGHQHRLLRDKYERVSKTLKRIVLTTVNSQNKKNRKRKHREMLSESTPPSLEAHLYTPTGELVGEEVLNDSAWEEGSTLQLGSVRYKVHVNLPTVSSLKLPKFAMTGCPMVPQVSLEFTDFYSCRWEWFQLPGDHDHTPDHTSNHAHLQLLSTSHAYWPSDTDSGHKLLLRCIPACNGREGEAATTVSAVIAESPKATPITRRHLLTPARLARPDAFRIVSYNTLAGQFTTDEYAHTVLYPYCDPIALDIEYRQGRIVHELLGYNADILSLQEVGTTMFRDFLQPALRDKGYEGCHMQKSSSVHEGEAIFYDSSRFTLLAQEGTSLSEFLEKDASCCELHKGLASAPKFLNDVTRKGSIVLVTLLKSVEQMNSYLLVANTHLYYHPKGDHVRLVQSAILVNYLRAQVSKFSRELGDEARIATVIGGDLNSCPCIAAYNYLVSGRIGRDHKDWMCYKAAGIPQCQCYYKHNFGVSVEPEPVGGGIPVATDNSDLPPHIQFKLNKDAEENAVSAHSHSKALENFGGLELQHDFRFQNVTGIEHCTNYTANFKAVLDYILIDTDHLELDRLVPLPTVGEVSEFVALPSVYFPSDHLALVADVNWTHLAH